ISLLQPASARLLEAMKPLAEATVQALAEADAGGDTFTVAWRSLSMALLEYRRGNYADAMRWSARCLGNAETNAPRSATARLITAMAHFQLGQGAEAQAELERVREVIAVKFEGVGDRGSPIRGFWFDWMFARVLLREASGLVGAGL
ncbi:MAG TPA: serine/threonine protein kinase, partial [Opitutus sp.]|nr:serine/threonine protein kinase [Opitutus sp.]